MVRVAVSHVVRLWSGLCQFAAQTSAAACAASTQTVRMHRAFSAAIASAAPHRVARRLRAFDDEPASEPLSAQINYWWHAANFTALEM